MTFAHHSERSATAISIILQLAPKIQRSCFQSLPPSLVTVLLHLRQKGIVPLAAALIPVQRRVYQPDQRAVPMRKDLACHRGPNRRVAGRDHPDPGLMVVWKLRAGVFGGELIVRHGSRVHGVLPIAKPRGYSRSDAEWDVSRILSAHLDPPRAAPSPLLAFLSSSILPPPPCQSKDSAGTNRSKACVCVLSTIAALT